MSDETGPRRDAGPGSDVTLCPEWCFDGLRARDRVAVHLRAGRIHDVIDLGARRTPLPGTVIGFPGSTLLPGLIDAHSHLGVTTMGHSEESLLDKAAAIITNASVALDYGYTTLRDLGGVDGALSRAIAAGRVRGPDVLPSGPLLCQSGGHGDQRPPFGWPPAEAPGVAGLHQFSLPCDGADGVRRAAREAFRRGATQLKLCLSGGIVSHSDALEDTQFTHEEIAAAVGEASARGTYVTAHAFTPSAIRRGLEAGVRCFEHATFLDDATAALLLEHDVPIVPTLSVVGRLRVHQHEWGIPDAALTRLTEIDAANAAAVRRATTLGVRVGSGSDAIGPDQSARSAEIVAKADLVGSEAALRSATSVNATVVRRTDRGLLAPGNRADLLLVHGDLLATPQLLLDEQAIQAVVLDGRWVKGG